MNELTRRSLLLGATTLAGATALAPVALAAGAAPAAVASEVAARLPAWIVGTPDDYDWHTIRAATQDEAIAEWLDEMGYVCECGKAMPDGDIIDTDDCERCSRSLEAERMPRFDAIDNPAPGDWLRAGMGAYCSRCAEETHVEYGAHAIGDEAVCEDCMTLDDWRIVDPDRAAEMEAEDLA